MKSSYHPASPLPGIYPEEIKIEKDSYIPMFIVALFTIARTWKQPRCSSTDEWTKKLQYIYMQRNITQPIKTGTNLTQFN